MIIIKNLCTNDFDAWLPLWQRYLAFGAQTNADAATQATWQRISADPPQIHGIGAFAGTQLLGFAHFHQQYNTWRVGGVIYIEDLFIAPQARRQGVARHLIEHIFTLAREKGCEKVFWKAHAGNEGARALYRQLARETDFVEYEKIL